MLKSWDRLMNKKKKRVGQVAVKVPRSFRPWTARLTIYKWANARPKRKAYFPLLGCLPEERTLGGTIEGESIDFRHRHKAALLLPKYLECSRELNTEFSAGLRDVLGSYSASQGQHQQCSVAWVVPVPCTPEPVHSPQLRFQIRITLQRHRAPIKTRWTSHICGSEGGGPTRCQVSDFFFIVYYCCLSLLFGLLCSRFASLSSIMHRGFPVSFDASK